jgi:hypothetical protein
MMNNKHDKEKFHQNFQTQKQWDQFHIFIWITTSLFLLRPWFNKCSVIYQIYQHRSTITICIICATILIFFILLLIIINIIINDWISKLFVSWLSIN